MPRIPSRGLWLCSWQGCFLLVCSRGRNALDNVHASYVLKCLYSCIISPLNLLYARVGKFNNFNLSGYSILFRPSTNFVARIWTFSIWFIYFLRYGAHTDWAYSKWGRTKAVNNLLNDLQSRYVKLRRIRPTMAFAVRILLDMCSSNDNSESIITPKSFSSKTCSISSAQILYRFVYLMFSNLPSVRIWHLSGWNLSSHFRDQSSKVSMSDCKISASSWELMARNIFVSSAKR